MNRHPSVSASPTATVTNAPDFSRSLKLLRLAAEITLSLFVGAVGYYLIEILFRGYSHPSMALAGGICFLLLYGDNCLLCRHSVVLRAAVGAFLITAVEFAAGCVLNLGMGLHIWDYSNLPLNLLGQVSLPFSGLWFLLCFPLCALCRLLRQQVFGRLP